MISTSPELYEENKTKVETLLLSNGQQGMVHILDPIRASDQFPPVVNLDRPSAMDCDAYGGKVYFYDSATKMLARRGIQGGEENPVEIIRKGNRDCSKYFLSWVLRKMVYLKKHFLTFVNAAFFKNRSWSRDCNM